MSIVFAMILTYLIITAYGYIGHRILHKPWAGIFNKYHMTHHMVLYPSNDCLSDSYRSAGADNTVKAFAIMSLPIMAIPFILFTFNFISLYLMLIIIFEMFLIGWMHSYFHDVFHIRNHFLSKIPIIKVLFNKFVILHYMHHVNLEKNFGIFTFFWDRLFRTFIK